MLSRLTLILLLAAGSSTCLAADDLSAPALSLDVPATAPSSAPFSADSWSFSVTGDYFHSISSHTAAAAYGGELSLGYYPLKDFAVIAEIPVYHVHQDGPDTFGVGAGLLARWHFVHTKQFTLFVDGGADFLATRKPVPAGGTYVNFTSKAGLGFTLQLMDNLSFIAGSRLLHLSNAGIRGSVYNPSINLAIEGYAGLMLCF